MRMSFERSSAGKKKSRGVEKTKKTAGKSSPKTPAHEDFDPVTLPAADGRVFDHTGTKKAHATPGHSEALLRSILQASPMGIGIVRNRILGWTNDQVSRMTGYAPGELIGQSARTLYHSDEEFDRVGRHKYADIRSKGTGSIVTVWRRKDGRLINVFLSSTPIDPADLSAGVVFTAMDITEKQSAQDGLWRSEEKYRALFENAVMGIFQSTPHGRFLSVNPATAKMCGYSSPEEMAATITDIATQHYVDPAERDLFVKAFEEQGFVLNFEHRTFRKDGSIFWVSVNARAVKDRRGKVLYYEGTHEDITGRKEAEEKQRLSEEKYRAIFENSLVGIFQSTPEGRYIRVNPAFARIYGYESPEDAISSITDIGTQIFVDRRGPETLPRHFERNRHPGAFRDPDATQGRQHHLDCRSTPASSGMPKAGLCSSRGSSRTSRRGKTPRRPCGQARSDSSRSSSPTPSP